MDAYIWQSDIYCADCGKAIQAKLQADHIEPHEDSDHWPQGPYSDGGGEADNPQHCGACYVFLENALTGDGYAHIRKMMENHTNIRLPIPQILREWIEFYEMES